MSRTDHYSLVLEALVAEGRDRSTRKAGRVDRRLKQLDRVPRRVLDDRLAPACSLDHLVAEARPRAA